MYDMPKGIKDAPLDAASPDGQDYITLMNWAGDFAEAGHKWLHVYLMEQLAERVDIAYSTTETIFSRHNSMWITHDGYVHRKGATPADLNQKGVIPATMGHPTGMDSGATASSHTAERMASVVSPVNGDLPVNMV